MSTAPIRLGLDRSVDETEVKACAYNHHWYWEETLGASRHRLYQVLFQTRDHRTTVRYIETRLPFADHPAHPRAYLEFAGPDQEALAQIARETMATYPWEEPT